MKLKLNEGGDLFVNKKESGDFEVIVVESDGREHKVDILSYVKKTRSEGAELAEKRKQLKDAEESLGAFKGEDGVLLDVELAKTAIKKLKELKDKAVDADSRLAAAEEGWKKKLEEALKPLNDQVLSLKQEKKKAMLLGASPLQKTLHYTLGEKHLMAEFGHLVDDDGRLFDWQGKPVMSPSNPSSPATIEEAAELWVATHPKGKDAIIIDGFKGGAGDPKDKKQPDVGVPGDGYDFLVANSQK